MDVTIFEKLTEFTSDFKIIEKLWQSRHNWQIKTAEWNIT